MWVMHLNAYIIQAALCNNGRMDERLDLQNDDNTVT